MKIRFLRTDVQFPTLLLYLKKKEYLIFLEESMNYSHLVWMDITVLIIKTEFCSLRSYVFPNTEGTANLLKKQTWVPQPFCKHWFLLKGNEYI